MESGRYQVLLVEKDVVQAYLLEEKLREAGWVVASVDSSARALRCCEKRTFDAAIINYHYAGGINGLELSERLRMDYNTPSLIITATRLKVLEKDPKFTTQQEFLFKPYRLMECGPRLDNLLGTI